MFIEEYTIGCDRPWRSVDQCSIVAEIYLTHSEQVRVSG